MNQYGYVSFTMTFGTPLNILMNFHVSSDPYPFLFVSFNVITSIFIVFGSGTNYVIFLCCPVCSMLPIQKHFLCYNSFILNPFILPKLYLYLLYTKECLVNLTAIFAQVCNYLMVAPAQLNGGDEIIYLDRKHYDEYLADINNKLLKQTVLRDLLEKTVK